MYNIVNGHMHYLSNIFVQSNLPYHFNHISTINFIIGLLHKVTTCIIPLYFM